MVTLFGLLNTGASGIFASQAGLNTTGHNIANASTEGYSRQRINLTTNYPLNLTPGSVGTGVLVRNYERFRDAFLEGQIRAQLGTGGFLKQQQEGFDKIQVLLSDPLNPVSSSLDNPSESGLNYVLKQFFSAFQELSTAPESASVRSSVVQTAVTLAETFNLIDRELARLQTDTNKRIELLVTDINTLTREIAALNVQIGRVESDARNSANDLRDQRDLLLRQLAAKVPLQTFEDEQGQVLVSILGVAVVNSGNATDLVAKTVAGGTGLADIYFDLPGSRVLTSDFDRGEIGGLLDLRDRILPELRKTLDNVAYALADQVNRVHSRATPLVAFREATGLFSATNAALPLVQSGLQYPFRNGQITIRIHDDRGVVVKLLTVNVDAADSLATLAAKISNADGEPSPGAGMLTASPDSGNRLLIRADGNLRFTIAGDTSGVLASLGVNTFFTGNSAGTIAVRDDLRGNLNLIAASMSGAPGDNAAALEIAQIEYAAVMQEGTTTIGDYYRSAIAATGVEARRVSQNHANTELLLSSLTQQQESVSGVSIDEEAINLIRFQQSFAASARFITGTDELIDLIVNRLGLTGR